MQVIGSEIYQGTVQGFQSLTSKSTHSKINSLISSQWNARENISTVGFVSTRRLDVDCSGVSRCRRKSTQSSSSCCTVEHRMKVIGFFIWKRLRWCCHTCLQHISITTAVMVSIIWDQCNDWNQISWQSSVPGNRAFITQQAYGMVSGQTCL